MRRYGDVYYRRVFPYRAPIPMTVFISVDCETDGPVPGLNSMLELGAVAVVDGEVTDQTFSRFISPLEGAVEDPLTLAWWRTQPEAKKRITEAMTDRGAGKAAWEPDAAIADFAQWCQQFHKPIAAAWPAAFDWPFINYYMHKFLHQNPLGYSCLDIRSYVAGLVRADDYSTPKEHEIYELAGGERDAERKAHAALDDAVGQAHVLAGALAYANRDKAAQGLRKGAA